MYVCICQAVTESSIRRAVEEGATTLPELGMRTGAGTQCGSCVPLAREIIDEVLTERARPPTAINLRVVCVNGA